MSRLEDSKEVIRLLRVDNSEVVVEVEARRVSSSTSSEVLAVSKAYVSLLNKCYLEISYPLLQVFALDLWPP